MPIYRSSERVKSGVPLGGIGAGKIEILPNGMFDFFTIFNNSDNPLSENPHLSVINHHPDDCAKGVLGFNFGLVVPELSFGKLLSTRQIADYKKIDDIEFNGEFPFANLKFLDKDLLLDVDLTAYSSFIPHDVKNSSLPLAAFKFRIKNTTDKRINPVFYLSSRNLVGRWNVGRYSKIFENSKIIGATHFKENACRDDATSGDFTMAVKKQEWLDISYMGEFNLQRVPFIFNDETTVMDAWEHLLHKYCLPNTNEAEPLVCENYESASAFALKVSLAPGEERTVDFAFSWFFPNSEHGHAYERHFKNSRAVSEYFFSDGSLEEKTKSWHEKIRLSELDSWLKDAFLNNLYPLFSSTIFTRKKQFAVFESPVVCPLTGTLDVRFYGSFPLFILFPELELIEMKQFVKAQRENGYIPHDLGRKRLDLPSNGTTNLKWKDLNPKFILLVYRDYLLTKDKNFLKKSYPSVLKAFDWIMSTDKNKDGLPDNEGQDQTFDLWVFLGANSYTSGIFLTAVLAIEKMAEILNDKKTRDKMKEHFKIAKENFEKKLWNEYYFISYNNHDRCAEDSVESASSCMAAQLIGQWYAHILNLGYIVDKVKVKKALGKILELNGKDSAFGATNSILATGGRDHACLQSKNVWVGLSYAIASLAIYEGFYREGMELAKKTWLGFVQKAKSPWNQPDLLDAEDGSFIFGDHYMRNMCIWSLLLPLSKINKDAKGILDSLSNGFAKTGSDR